MAAGRWQDHRLNDKKGLSERLQKIQNWGTNPLQEKHLHYIYYIYVFIQTNLEERNKASLQGANNIRNIQCQVNLTTISKQASGEKKCIEYLFVTI